MDNREYFFVTSYGRTATVWLARALNLHGDIICSHGPSLVPIIPRQGIPYTKESVIEAQNSATKFYTQTFNKTLTDIAAGSNARWVGNIHGFTATNLWFKRWSQYGAHPFRTVNLLRHPITRIHSLCKRWDYEREFNSPMTKWIAANAVNKPQYRHIIGELRRYHDIALDNFQDRAFFYAVMQTVTDDSDLHVGVEHIISEKLVSDSDYFVHTVKALMGNNISLSKEYLNNVKQLGKQNEAGQGERSEIEIFEEWQPWQKTLFFMFLRDYTWLRSRYTELGYNLPPSELSAVKISDKSSPIHVSLYSLKPAFSVLRYVKSMVISLLRTVLERITRNNQVQAD